MKINQYHNKVVLIENKSIPLPTFICTDESYFKEREYHLNTMAKAKGLPLLFITLSMADTK